MQPTSFLTAPTFWLDQMDLDQIQKRKYHPTQFPSIPKSTYDNNRQNATHKELLGSRAEFKVY